MNIKQTIEHAKEFPFDGNPPTDDAHLAALAVLTDLSGRRGVGNELESIDDDIKAQLVEDLTDIIRAVFKK